MCWPTRSTLVAPMSPLNLRSYGAAFSGKKKWAENRSVCLQRVMGAMLVRGVFRSNRLSLMRKGDLHRDGIPNAPQPMHHVQRLASASSAIANAERGVDSQKSTLSPDRVQIAGKPDLHLLCTFNCLRALFCARVEGFGPKCTCSAHPWGCRPAIEHASRAGCILFPAVPLRAFTSSVGSLSSLITLFPCRRQSPRLHRWKRIRTLGPRLHKNGALQAV